MSTVTPPPDTRETVPTDVRLYWALRAQNACPQSLGNMSEEEIGSAVEAGALQVWIAQDENSTVVLCGQRDGQSAIIGAFYAEGDAASFWHLTNDVRAQLVEWMRSEALSSAFGAIAIDHPELQQLVKVYERLGFRPDCVRIVMHLERV